jgi:hypothetical protein
MNIALEAKQWKYIEISGNLSPVPFMASNPEERCNRIIAFFPSNPIPFIQIEDVHFRAIWLELLK